ncbi:hypothetical protein FRB96_008692 [Tulasnella sp. 330]|nr:hypothetical protein FRB96_008692 [Tulasnella sp. 330]KAG8875355.1 hypothetical protein FRB97_005193 [Tulasnella sp. 331]KAG8879843.1 hypothetical protein FRB98_005492 [Tulasnella sp. 332]
MATSSSGPNAQPSASHGSISSSALDASTFQRLHPRAYLERFLAEGIRPDGRESEEWRQVSVNVGSISTADGSALVKMGDTTVVCGIKAEIAEPDLDTPNHGWLVPNVDLPAICSPKFKPGPPGEEAQVLSERLNEVLSLAQVVPTTSLCIETGKAAWVLYIDVTCINYDGNPMDATLLAVMAALRNTCLPNAKFDEDTGRTTCSRGGRSPLDIRRVPLCASFGIFDKKCVLSDPSAFEEPLLETSMSVVVDEKGEVVSALQLGLGPKHAPVAGKPLGHDIMASCLRIAKRRRLQLEEAIRQ